MSSSEIRYRMQKAALTQVQQLGLFTAKDIPEPDLTSQGKIFVKGLKGIDVTRYSHAADQTLAGQIPIFALSKGGLGAVPEWNRDPLTKTMAPLVFGKQLNYRDSALVGDIKYLWEPNRHLHLVALAQTYYLTGEQCYLKGLQDQLESWFDQCPYLFGPNWTSSLELGIRLINWSIVWQLIGGKDSPLFDGPGGAIFLQRWLESIYQHAHFIKGYFSRFSSANNHLIGEVAGLFVASMTWPFWDEMRRWGDIAKSELVYEALLQNGVDGVNQEQAISYQQFVLDFLVIAGLAGGENNNGLPEEYWSRIEAMLEYLASLMDVGGNMPMIGDADDGYVVKLSHELEFCPYRALLATGAVFFNRGDFKVKAGHLDDKTRWLLGEQSDNYFAIKKDDCDFPIRRAFTEGGYYILGSDFETPEEIRLVVDAGPLGYQSIAAHGHADALAFTLSAAGREFLIDPGTFAYHTNLKWRNYFRGTAAHNTVRVDGLDQSVIGGNFMWLQHAQTKCEYWELSDETDSFCGSHNGYTRLPDPVLHKRTIVLDKREKKITVEDALFCNTEHAVERFWHFSEYCQISRRGRDIVVENSGIPITLSFLEDDIETAEYTGNEELPAGWVSRQFDVKYPCPTLVWKSTISGATVLTTEIDCSATQKYP